MYEHISICEGFSRNEGCKPFLTRKQVEERCPVAFASEATHPTCSEHYVPLRTADVMDLVSTFGWLPVSAKQTGKGPMPARSLHMMVFEHPEKSVNAKGSPIGVPRLILINSLDGFTKLQFFCGFFRFVCSNGLIVSDASFSSLKVRHAKTNMDAVATLIKEVLDKMDPAMEKVSRMASTELDEQLTYNFYLQALALRINFRAPQAERKELKDYLYIDNMMMEPLHEADKGRSDLWYHYNNMQERASKGRFAYLTLENGKAHNLRMISGISRNVDFNKQLFELANQFLPIE